VVFSIIFFYFSFINFLFIFIIKYTVYWAYLQKFFIIKLICIKKQLIEIINHKLSINASWIKERYSFYITLRWLNINIPLFWRCNLNWNIIFIGIDFVIYDLKYFKFHSLHLKGVIYYYQFLNYINFINIR